MSLFKLINHTTKNHNEWMSSFVIMARAPWLQWNDGRRNERTNERTSKTNVEWTPLESRQRRRTILVDRRSSSSSPCVSTTTCQSLLAHCACFAALIIHSSVSLSVLQRNATRARVAESADDVLLLLVGCSILVCDPSFTIFSSILPLMWSCFRGLLLCFFLLVAAIDFDLICAFGAREIQYWKLRAICKMKFKTWIWCTNGTSAQIQRSLSKTIIPQN